MSMNRNTLRRTAAAAALAVLAALPAIAEEWQKVGEIPWREVNLTADQPGVSYDERSYKFYATETRRLQNNQALMLTARSWSFQPEILVWNNAGQVIARCAQDDPYPDPNNGQTVYSCSVDVNAPPTGSYSIVTTTRDISQGVVSIGGSLWEMPGEAVVAEKDLGDPTGDTRVRRCQELEGAERTLCLAEISINEYDPSACDVDPSGDCRRQAAAAIMQKCQTITDPLKRAACFLEVSSGWKDVDSCTYADEPDLCVIHVAAASQNPQIVVDRFRDHPDYDAQLALYGTLSGDLYAAELMRDNQKADYATIMIGMIMMARGEPLPDGFCGGLRGGYPEANDDLDIEGMLNLCRKSVARGQELIARLQGASDDDWQRIVDEFLKEMEAMADESEEEVTDITIEPLAPPSPGGVDTGNPSTSGSVDCEGLLGQGDC